MLYLSKYRSQEKKNYQMSYKNINETVIHVKWMILLPLLQILYNYTCIFPFKKNQFNWLGMKISVFCQVTKTTVYIDSCNAYYCIYKTFKYIFSYVMWIIHLNDLPCFLFKFIFFSLRIFILRIFLIAHFSIEVIYCCCCDLFITLSMISENKHSLQ